MKVTLCFKYNIEVEEKEEEIAPLLLAIDDIVEATKHKILKQINIAGYSAKLLDDWAEYPYDKPICEYYLHKYRRLRDANASEKEE